MYDDKYWAAVEKSPLAKTLLEKAEEAEDTWATTNEENPGYPNGPGVQEKELIEKFATGDSDVDAAISGAITTIFIRFDKLLNVTFPNGIDDEDYSDLRDWLKENLIKFDRWRKKYKRPGIVEEIQYESENVSTPEELLINLERCTMLDPGEDPRRREEWERDYGRIYETYIDALNEMEIFLDNRDDVLKSEFDLGGLLEEGLGYNALYDFYYEKGAGTLIELLPKYDLNAYRYNSFEDAKENLIEDLINEYPEYYDKDREDLDIDEIARRLILKDENGKFYVEEPGSSVFWDAVSSDDEEQPAPVAAQPATVQPEPEPAAEPFERPVHKHRNPAPLPPPAGPAPSYTL